MSVNQKQKPISGMRRRGQGARHVICKCKCFESESYKNERLDQTPICRENKEKIRTRDENSS